MKLLLQLLKPILPLYKRVSLLLFLISAIQTFNAQSFYFVEGTQITIDETTTFFVTDSGKINQARLRNFEGQTSIINHSLSERTQLVFNNKKPKLNSKKEKKQSVSKSSKKGDKTFQKAKSAEFIKPFPYHFYSSCQQLVAVSISVSNINYDQKFLNENIILKSIHRYSDHVNNEIVNNTFLFFNDYHLSNHMTRPPPFEFYCKKHILNS
ncbi:hypothetical protein [Chryseobacterium sp.]|uniref:hypothetical protein n=1 Tax=Chryseobacterium sp. TaxID=1871047 RepID=UPI00289C2D1E|nr:hypothetical protein [Chryseobacterium sp.]